MGSKRKVAAAALREDAKRSRKVRRLSHDGTSPSPSHRSQTASDDGENDEDGEADSGDDQLLFEMDDVPDRAMLPSRTRPPIPPSALTPIAQSPVVPQAPIPVEFEELGLSPSLIRSLKTMSIRRPTPVQSACIPPLLAGEWALWMVPIHVSLNHTCPGLDCIGNAKTGSGKTVAFALPILQKLSTDPYGIFALVLTPTRCVSVSLSVAFARLMTCIIGS